MSDKLTLKLQTDCELIPRPVASQRILEISVQAPDSPKRENRPRLNLALVLDRSGSMSGGKLEYVKQAAIHLLDRLEDGDRIAIVAYDDRVDVLLAGTAINDQIRSNAKARISRLRPGNMTNLSGGWLAGCHEAAEAVSENTLNRALLLTDGLANHGITDPEILYNHARELAARGISTSTFGVGEGFNEHLLEGMANQGGGNFYFIGSPTEIPDLFVREFSEISAITARDVEIEIGTSAGVSYQVLGEWRTETDADRLRIQLGSLYGGRQQRVYVRLLIPPALGNTELVVPVKVRALGVEALLLEQEAAVTYLYADEKDVQARPPLREVLERFARVDLAQTTSEALKKERRGQRQQARDMVMASLAANAPYLSEDEEGEYRRMADRMERGMQEMDRKQSHFHTYVTKRGREEQ